MRTLMLKPKQKQLLLSFVMVILMVIPTFFTMGIIYEIFNKSKNYYTFLRIGVWLLFLSFYFLMNYQKKIDKYRAILFVAIAVAFPVDFIARLYELRSHVMTVTFDDMIQGQVPFCHIVIPQTILSLLMNKQVVFPGSITTSGGFFYTIGFMIITWLGVSLLLGRGWCSWACFFGGWEDGFSRISKKPVIKNISKKLLYIPFAILVSAALLSTIFLFPAYCMWLCPFKAVSEFVEVTSPLVVVQTIIFAAIFVVLIIILPILTKKRTQRAFICPFGAMQSLVDKINPFRIRIDLKKCTKCGRCIKICPVIAIGEENLVTGKVRIGCVKCGKCIDVCNKKAISYHIKGTPVSDRFALFAKGLFNYLGFFIIATMGSSFILSALDRLYLLATTGSIAK